MSRSRGSHPWRVMLRGGSRREDEVGCGGPRGQARAASMVLRSASSLKDHVRARPVETPPGEGSDEVSKPFKGTINIDIRDSVPDWAPFEPPKAPDGAPSVVYIVLDDVGFSAMRCYGGPIETPNIERIAASGVRFTQWHTTALCSPTRSCLLTGRNHTRNSMACITEAATGFPNASGTCARRTR